MAKKIAITLRKGGVGKTSLASNLATALHQKGKKTLLVDLDPQCNATVSVGIDPESIEKHSINKLFTDINTKPEEVIVKTSFGLSLLPSHPDLADTSSGMKASQIGLLKSIVSPLDGFFDYIVIDTPPSESFLTVSALACADKVIIPLQAHYLAMRGLQEAINEVNQIKQGINPELEIAGILPTMVNSRTNIAKTVLDAVKDTYKDLLYPVYVEFSIKHTEANLAGLPIVLFDPKHQGSRAYKKLADLVIKRGKK